MKKLIPIELSDNDFREIRSLFPREAAGTIDRQTLAMYVAEFWKWTRQWVTHELGKWEVVAIDGKGRRAGVILSTFDGAHDGVAALAIEIFKRACRFLRERCTIVIQDGKERTVRFLFGWMTLFGASLA